jgi:hypothetical protein
MILLPALYLDGAVDLFEEDYSGEGVREGDPAEGPEFPGDFQDFGGETQGAADREGDVALARDAEVFELLREFFR